MDGNSFSVSFSGVSVSAAQDVFSLVASSRTRLEIRWIRLGQITKASEESIAIQLIRGYTTAGSGGNAATPAPYRPWSRAAVTAARINDTTLAANGTPVVLLADAWSLLRPWKYGCPIDVTSEQDEPIYIEKSDRFVVRITAPAAGYTMYGSIGFREIGMIAP